MNIESRFNAIRARLITEIVLAGVLANTFAYAAYAAIGV